jgi:hypothetical protein
MMPIHATGTSRRKHILDPKAPSHSSDNYEVRQTTKGVGDLNGEIALYDSDSKKVNTLDRKLAHMECQLVKN